MFIFSIMDDPQIPEPDYSPIIIRKISKQPKKKENRKSNFELWGNAARYKGSLEELDQSESPDESQSSSTKVKDLVEKLKHQTERDQRRRQQRLDKNKGKN